jgi:hypothetical protein
LVLVLAFVALVSLRPWEADSVDPHMSASPGIGALGDAVAVARDRSPGLAEAGIEDLARATPAVERGSATGGSGSTLAVSLHRAVGTAPPPPAAPAPPASKAEPPTSNEPAPAPVAPPPPSTSVAEDGEGAGGPSTAVVEVEPEPSCEGDEYVIAIRFLTKAIGSDEAGVEILILRIGRDGSESEIQLEGQFGEVGELLERVASEGDCVEVNFEPAAEEGRTKGSSEAPVATTGHEEELEPVLP